MPIDKSLQSSCLNAVIFCVAVLFSVQCSAASNKKPTGTVSDNNFLNRAVTMSQPRFVRIHYYKIDIGEQLNSAKIKACFSGKAPEYLAVDYRRSTRNITSFPKSESGNVEIVGRYWKTKYLSENACIEYSASISEHLVRRKKDGFGPLSYQQDNTWLWLPEELAHDESVIIEFSLPKGVNLSVPWQQLEAPNQFQISRFPIDWGFTLVIGDFKQSNIKLSDQTKLEINYIGELRQAEALTKWITQVGDSLKNYLGQFPTPKVQLVIMENSRFKYGPVPWGEVNRGGGFGIRFVVNSQMDIKHFYKDWTASHEFAHLLVPKFRYEDIWLSEGLASYLQYILMARAGQIGQQEAWQKLYEGLLRGEKGTQRLGEETLKETMQNRGKSGWRSGRTMRIYWSGAAYFLLADWKLRLESNGKLGLNDVLRKFNSCCSESPKLWTGKEFAETLDSISGYHIFTNLHQQIENSSNFPDYMPAFKGLGIAVEGEKISLKIGKGELWRNQIDSP